MVAKFLSHWQSYKMNKLHKLSDEKLLTLVETNSNEEICKEFSISQRTLSRILHKRGMVRKNYGPKGLTKEEKRTIRQLYADGIFTQKELGVKYGVSQAMICKVVNERLNDLVFGGSADVRVGYRYDAN